MERWNFEGKGSRPYGLGIAPRVLGKNHRHTSADAQLRKQRYTGDEVADALKELQMRL